MQSLVTGNAWADATTSANLSQFTSGAALSTDNGTTWDSDSSWTVKPGQNYQVKVSFAEREDAQFDMNRDLSYKLPTGFNPNGNSANVDITVQYTDTDGTNKSVTIAGNSFVVGNDGNVTFKWNKNDPNFQKLAEANNVQFDLTFGGQFSSDVTRLDFGHSITKDVTVDTSHDVNVQKEGSYNQTDGKVHYKVTVTSTGTNENVVVTDAITGTALTYDNNVQATSDSTATGTAAKKDNGFTYTIPNMTDGQKVVLEYTASVDFDSLTGKGTVQQTGNGVTVKIDGKDKPGETTTNLENRIDYSGLTKAAGEATGDGNVKTVPWTVTYNEKATASMAGRTITDSIGATSQDIMKYKGDVTVTVKDASGKVVRTDKVTPAENATSYSYKVPEGDKDPYVYVFTYNTTVDMTGKVTDATVTNEAHDNKGQSSTGTTNVGPGTPADLKKTATKVTVDKISWTTSFNVPKAGLTKAEVTDTLPGMHIDKQYYDELDAGSLVVKDSNGNTYSKDATSGLGYTLTTGASSEEATKGAPTFTLKFYYYNDKGEKVDGVPASDAAHTISVSYDTRNNAEWMAKYAENIDDYRKVHTNKVSANLNGTVLTAEATATPKTDKNKVTKVAGNNGQPVGYQTLSNGTKLPVWKFTLQLKGEPTANMQVTDEFNTSLFSVVDAKSLKEAGTPYDVTSAMGIESIDTTNTFGNEYDGTYGNYVAMSQTNSGVTFTVSQDNIDKARKKDKPKEQPYTGDNFRITYYLVAKDANALKTLNQQAATAAKTFTNTAKWDSSESAQNFTYQYKPISKTATDLLAEVAGTDYKNVIKYTLVINPDAQQVGTGDTLTATDTISNNLAFIYDSIQVTPSEGVTYDASGSTLTFKVPNAARVTVTYYAKVIKTGTFDVTNTATVNGQSEKVTKNVTLNASGSGTASIPSIKVLKYKSGDMSTALAGAKFALFDNEAAANRAAADPSDLDATHFCGVYTTDANGLVLIDAYTSEDGVKDTSRRLWKSKQYYLVELQAPAGYEKTTTVFKFKLADQPDYDNYVYYLGDEMKVYNKEQQTGSLEITKTTTGGTTPAEATFTIAGPNNYSKTVKYSEFTDGKYTVEGL
ncbi:MAG: SpaA isopeptide-forming pilin-related protein, partial [Olegusella sp.]|nr:SpaA isopeptide-forming pilin-related protein [Olegusella sp.]